MDEGIATKSNSYSELGFGLLETNLSPKFMVIDPGSICIRSRNIHAPSLLNIGRLREFVYLRASATIESKVIRIMAMKTLMGNMS
jgi:hypothetical protein